LLQSTVVTDPALHRRLNQMFQAGAWVLRESAIADLPADLRWLFESGALTIEQLARLHSATAVTSAADLVGELQRQPGRPVRGLDAETTAAVAAALPGLQRTVARLTLGRATVLIEPILALLRSEPGVVWAEAAGSLRRGQETVGDVELVAATTDPAAVFSAITATIDVLRVLHRSERRLYILTDGVQIGIRCPPPPQAGATLLHVTGSHAHVTLLRARANERDWLLSPDGLIRERDQPPIGATEVEIYNALDLLWVPAEIRTGDGELAAAEAGTLPTLISRADIRGDLHMHTSYSDGRDTVDVMVQAAAALGYEYIAITDHSPHSAASRSLSIDDVRRQADEIAALRQRFPQMTILHGCEVDILRDGRLDFPDKVLERFDIVLASLHDRANQGAEQLLRRYLEAMRHPLVTLITHPGNRLVPHRAGYPLDYDQLFAAAVETGTVVEVDGAPSHLDLDGERARQAMRAGALIAIDSDSHRADALDRQMEFGIKTARRGWLEARHVMNTRPIQELRALIAGKRGR
jgi:DNA polymerase (family 10)